MPIPMRRQTVIAPEPQGGWWVVTAWWDGLNWRHLSTVRIHLAQNLLACVARVAYRDDYVIRVRP